MTTRRQLIRIVPALPLISAAGAAALLTACGDKKPVDMPATAPTAAPQPAPATSSASPVATGPMVDEKDAAAVSLGYVSDASKVDKAKHPQYVAGSVCSNCALYQGAAGSAQGPCPLYAGKQVAGKGWCTAWAKQAA